MITIHSPKNYGVGHYNTNESAIREFKKREVTAIPLGEGNIPDHAHVLVAFSRKFSELDLENMCHK